MNENLHMLLSNPVYCVPLAALANAGFLFFQKKQLKNSNQKAVFSQTFLIRNSLFVGLLVFLVIHFNTTLPYDDLMHVGPSPF